MATKEYKEISLPFRLIQSKQDIDDGAITIEAKGVVDGKTHYFLACFMSLNQESDYIEMRELLSNVSNKEVHLTLIFKKSQLKDFKLDTENLAEIMGDERFKNMELLLRGINETPQEDNPKEMLQRKTEEREEKPKKRKHKRNEFTVYSKGVIPGIMVWITFFLIIFIPFIWLYFIDKRSIGVAFFVSIIFMIITGGYSLFGLCTFCNKCYIKDKQIKIRKWYGTSRSCSVENIDKVVFERVDNRLWHATIWIKKFHIAYNDAMENYGALKDFLCENVDESRIEIIEK
ncbi:MAG: hypothetical protein K6G64_01860 [Eubacterium sp.]|nr:hypothetical protein [Eubacterium sp.]